MPIFPHLRLHHHQNVLPHHIPHRCFEEEKLKYVKNGYFNTLSLPKQTHGLFVGKIVINWLK